MLNIIGYKNQFPLNYHTSQLTYGYIKTKCFRCFQRFITSWHNLGRKYYSEIS